MDMPITTKTILTPQLGCVNSSRLDTSRQALWMKGAL